MKESEFWWRNGGLFFLKSTWVFIWVSLIGLQHLVAQQNDKIRVKAGSKIGSRDFTAAAYRFSAFQDGIIYYNAGVPGKGKLNYNYLLGEMHFIGPKNDTLALDNLYLVKVVAIADVKFHYDPQHKSFAEEIADFNVVKLLIKYKFNASDREKGVAYGQYSNTSATKNYGTFVVNGQVQNLGANEYLILSKKASYYLSDQNNHFFPVTKANIFKVFPKHKPAVESFIKEHRIDLNKEKDLKKLFAYCAQLT